MNKTNIEYLNELLIWSLRKPWGNKNYEDLIEKLLQDGADPNCTASYINPCVFWSPLELAVTYHDKKVLHLLLRYGANPEAGYPDKSIYSAIYIAKESGNEEITKILKDHVESKKQETELKETELVVDLDDKTKTITFLTNNNPQDLKINIKIKGE